MLVVVAKVDQGEGGEWSRRAACAIYINLCKSRGTSWTVGTTHHHVASHSSRVRLGLATYDRIIIKSFVIKSKETKGKEHANGNDDNNNFTN